MKRVLSILSLIMIMFGISACQSENKNYVLKINDIEIGQKQIEYYISENRSNVINQFQTEGEKVDTNFWKRKTKQNDTIANELKKIATEQCLTEQMLFMVAEEMDLIENASFENILEQLECENRERKEKLESGQVVYGRKNYELQTYMRYYLNNLSYEMLELCKETEQFGIVDEESLNQYLKKRVEKADIEINQPVYQKIKIK